MATARIVFTKPLERQPRRNLNLAWSVEEPAVVAAGSLLERALVRRDTLRRAAARAQLIGSAVDSIDVLVVGNVEDVPNQLQTIPFKDRNLLLDAKVIHDLARLPVRVRTDHRKKR